MNDNYEIFYTDDASNDIDEIHDYIAETLREKRTADRLIMRIRDNIDSLNQFPERYPVVEWEPFRTRRTRKLTVGHYVVFYNVEHERQHVIILRIVYGGRDIESMINRDEYHGSR